jgi:isoquinoline 1-oxidoreductase alpha subunit
MTRIVINGRIRDVDAGPDTPLLWVIREDVGLTGTKYGCGIAACGACTVHLDGKAARSCSVMLGDVGARRITTIEGLSTDRSHPLQKAWIAEQVPQCGYCQSGMLMAAAALLAEKPRPTDDDIGRGVTNLCRCGTYVRIRAAIRRAAGGDDA